ncbi:MAG TPA: VCBS repeat-containing protein [Steroidobacteraceae bacterium]|nr:VCBS repeat-containing protein [Steroidobacteraceae bacterium]
MNGSRMGMALLISVVLLDPVAIRPAAAQSIVQDVVIDHDPGAGEPLEKAVDYFTSKAFPSVVVGNGRGGLFLYRSASGNLQGPWKRSVIHSNWSAYERARAIRFPGHAYPDVVASIGNRIVWFENPMNGTEPAAVTRPWMPHVINSDHGCHDIRLEDLDGDGKVDVICSAGILLRAPAFVAFQNDPLNWQVIDNVAAVGDDIAVVRVGDDPTPNLVGADQTGQIFWYENPRLKGGNARTANWVKHYIGPGNVGNAFAAGKWSSTKDDVLTVDNEHEGPGGTGDSRGITWYEQPVDPAGPWIAHGMGASYRDVHEITLGQWHGGVPYVLVAEQEQACDPARPEGQAPSHPGVPCRIAMFQWIDGAPQKTVLAWQGTHNQALLPWEGGLLMADSNHGAYGASKAIHVRVIMP